MCGPPLAIVRNRYYVKIDDDKCVLCSICVKGCPTEGALVKDGEAKRIVVDKLKCGGCYKCVQNCPVKAIAMVVEGP